MIAVCLDKEGLCFVAEEPAEENPRFARRASKVEACLYADWLLNVADSGYFHDQARAILEENQND